MEKDELCIEVGALYETSVKDVLPEDTNDIVLWKTDDPSVATVYDGRIRARVIGTTTIIAYSQKDGVNFLGGNLEHRGSGGNNCRSCACGGHCGGYIT